MSMAKGSARSARSLDRVLIGKGSSVGKIGGSADAVLQSKGSPQPQRDSHMPRERPRVELGAWTRGSQAATDDLHPKYPAPQPMAHMKTAAANWTLGGPTMNDAITGGDLNAMPNGDKAAYNTIWQYWRRPARAGKDVVLYRGVRPPLDEHGSHTPTPATRAAVERWLLQPTRRMTATTTDPLEAVNWVAGLDPFVMEIHVPEGTAVLPIGNAHKEVVLPPGIMRPLGKGRARSFMTVTGPGRGKTRRDYTLVNTRRVKFEPVGGIPGPIVPKHMRQEFADGSLSPEDLTWLGLGPQPSGLPDLMPRESEAPPPRRSKPPPLTPRMTAAGIGPPRPRPKARQALRRQGVRKAAGHRKAGRPRAGPASRRRAR